ncbi:MAG: DUF721 domain-containing protein [Syntrophotaleaceae bacterium]
MSEPKDSNRKVDNLGTVINRFLEKRGLNERMRRYRAWQLWEKVVGPQIAARARPARMREDVLEVWVDHGVWMQQLQLLKPKLIARLNAALGEPLIRDLYLRQGGPRANHANVAPKPAELGWQKADLSVEEESRIEQTVANLADVELRDRLRELLRRQAKLAKTREKTGKKGTAGTSGT